MSAPFGRTVVFTGTSKVDLTEPQLAAVKRAFGRAGRLLHGCCVKADEQAARLMRAMWEDYVWIEGFPSNIPGMTAETLDDQRHEPAPPLERNRTMVDEAVKLGDGLLVAAPKGMAEELRSGTWATVRYARKSGLPVFICWPDGTHKYEPASHSPSRA